MDTWIININNHQGNVNKNHNEILPHTCQMASIEKTQISNVGKDMKKREPLHTVMEM